MAVFWRLAIRYKTFLLLTTSLFVAPLLLLRSDEFSASSGSTKACFRPGGRTIPRRVRRAVLRWLGIDAAIGIAVGLGLGYPAAKLYLVGHEGWSAFGRGTGLGLTISWLAGAGAVAGVVAGAGAAAAAGAAAGVVAAAGTVAAAAAGAAAAVDRLTNHRHAQRPLVMGTTKPSKPAESDIDAH